MSTWKIHNRIVFSRVLEKQVDKTFASALVVLWFAAGLHACSVPVFRYGLELWPQDRYRVTVLFKDSLDDKNRATVKMIAARAAKISGDTLGLALKKTSGEKTNVELELDNCTDSISANTAGLWQGAGSPPLPFCAVLFPPRAMNGKPLYAGPLSLARFDEMFDSPARRAFASDICKGMSAVWVFVASGNKKKDAVAARVLEDGIRQSKEILKLPDLDLKDVKEVVTRSDIDLRIDFALITVSRTDPRERCFVDQLEKTEAELAGMREEPIAFPVFARGRVLYALVGKGINLQNIMEASSFVTGPCACTIKDQNPGADILMTFDWEAALANKIASVVDTVPLVSMGAMISVPHTAPPVETRTPGFANADSGTSRGSPTAATASEDSIAGSTVAAEKPVDSGLSKSLVSRRISVKTDYVDKRPQPSGILRDSIVVPLFGGVFVLGALILVAFTILIGGTRRKRA
jgi:hypothetical protein